MALKATPNQVYAMMVTERVTSIFSLLGILFILSTFLLGRGFDKPINRLFFFASFSNLGMNIAALIAEDGTAGPNSSLCQFQAFAIQWYVGTTPLLLLHNLMFSQVPGSGYPLGFVHGFQCLPRLIPWMDHRTHAPAGVEILPRMLRLFLHTSLGLPLRQHQKPGKSLRSSSREYIIWSREAISNTTPALVLDRRP